MADIAGQPTKEISEFLSRARLVSALPGTGSPYGGMDTRQSCKKIDDRIFEISWRRFREHNHSTQKFRRILAIANACGIALPAISDQAGRDSPDGCPRTIRRVWIILERRGCARYVRIDTILSARALFMMRYLTIVCAALIAAVAFIGTSGEANAGCSRCGPIAPVYHYRTVNKVSNQTRFRDVSRTNYVHRTRLIYNITRIRPIVRVHTVTRVHHYSVPVIHNRNVSSVQRLPTQYVNTSSVQNINHGCGCH